MSLNSEKREGLLLAQSGRGSLAGYAHRAPMRISHYD